MTEQGEEQTNSSVLAVHQDEDNPLAPGLIAALTIGSMFVFYFLLMMVVCLGEWYQYTHGKKGKTVLVRTNSSSTSNSRSRNRPSRHVSYIDGSGSQSDPRPSSSAGYSVERSSNKRQNSLNRTEGMIVENEEQAISRHIAENEVYVQQNNVQVEVHVSKKRLQENVHLHVEKITDNVTGAQDYVGCTEITEDIEANKPGYVIESSHSTMTPLLPKPKTSSDIENDFEDDDLCSESTDSCYLYKTEASV